MNLDDHICYCYHVSMRKLIRFARRTRPQRPSQMTECLGAGTGCGWCIPFLCRIANDPDGFKLDELQPDQYAEQRRGYIVEKKPRNTFSPAAEGEGGANDRTPDEPPAGGSDPASE